MTRFGLVVSDVDGTLVTRDKVLTPRAIAAVERLHEAGIGFSICSSRPPFGLRMLVEPLQLKLPYGGYNAGRIVETDGSVVEERLIPPAAAKRAVEMFYDNGVTSIWVFSGNQWLIRDRNGDHVDHEIHTIQTPPTVVSSFDGHLDAAGKIVGASNDHGKVAACEAQGRAALAGSATVARSQPYYCDVTPPGIDKGRIVDLLGARLGVPRERIATLGDMGNDVEMFKKSGFAIAMGNATPEIKALAQAVTLSNEEDGFAAAIDRYILGDGGP
jgi:Cof subfamily protein (haloacid dehalogenase superfamily)